MRVLLLGRKPVACAALRYLLATGFEVPMVVASNCTEPDMYPERLADVAQEAGLPVLEDNRVYELLARGEHQTLNVDLVVSILHQKRILRPLIELGRIGCVNFHPAPLPEYRGWGTYNVAILENATRWGASAHFVDDGFDTGPLIRSRYFNVDCRQETALSLQQKTQPVLLQLFKDVLNIVRSGQELSGVPQTGGRSFTGKQVMAQRLVQPTDSPEVIERKIRAFWYPPNPPAEIDLHGVPHPLINMQIFRDLAPLVCEHSGWITSEEIDPLSS